jgi:hypothetical protein
LSIEQRGDRLCRVLHEIDVIERLVDQTVGADVLHRDTEKPRVPDEAGSAR